MKKTLLAVVITVLTVFMLAGCGGEPTTAQPAATTEEQPTVKVAFQELQKYTSVTDSLECDYLAEIKNTSNSPVKISNVSIELNDVNGELIGVTEYVGMLPEVINPGKSAYIMENVYSSTLGDSIAVDNIGEATLRYDISEAEEQIALSVELSETKMQINSYDLPEMIGRVTNIGDTNLEDVYVVGIIKNADGVLQNMLFTIINNLPAGQDESFSQMAIYGDPDTDYAASTIDFITFVQ